MSADNYIYVREHDGRWRVTMEFASCDVRPLEPRDPSFPTKDEALGYARKWFEDEYVEYGICCDEDLPTMYDAKRRGQEEIARAIKRVTERGKP